MGRLPVTLFPLHDTRHSLSIGQSHVSHFGEKDFQLLELTAAQTKTRQAQKAILKSLQSVLHGLTFPVNGPVVHRPVVLNAAASQD